MIPHRIRMAHNLILHYGLFKKMKLFVSLLIKKKIANLTIILFLFLDTKSGYRISIDGVSF